MQKVKNAAIYIAAVFGITTVVLVYLTAFGLAGEYAIKGLLAAWIGFIISVAVFVVGFVIDATK